MEYVNQNITSVLDWKESRSYRPNSVQNKFQHTDAVRHTIKLDRHMNGLKPKFYFNIIQKINYFLSQITYSASFAKGTCSIFSNS
jgi:hypothetical protein